MSFQNNEEYPLEFWSNELIEILAKVEGIPKKEARIRFMECLSTYIGLYELGFTPGQAIDKFWLDEVVDA